MSSEISEKETRKVAALARLALSDEEIALHRGQLARILDHVAELNSLDVSNTPETTHVLGLVNVLRDDEPELSASAAAIRESAPAFGNGHFKVPKVVE
ncbi:MAG: Asp-tRNA(Asn)/Glu-tRNA(Gln) amidotransferase GatCAB subunit C [Elusimicrobia bacterium]|nr:MAG: Asp-tRNA(Asn)/Glu-tRNA(Gln) amidotransferase GatCAB subunit C [Elusimicrobiota bacterium]